MARRLHVRNWRYRIWYQLKLLYLGIAERTTTSELLRPMSFPKKALIDPCSIDGRLLAPLSHQARHHAIKRIGKSLFVQLAERCGATLDVAATAQLLHQIAHG